MRDKVGVRRDSDGTQAANGGGLLNPARHRIGEGERHRRSASGRLLPVIKSIEAGKRVQSFDALLSIGT